MKSLLLTDLTEDFVKDSFLNTIKPHVHRIRQEFKKFALKLNPELGKTLINHFNERLRRANSTLMLGEYAPFLLGDLFSISKSTISKVVFPWFLMYEYSLLLDDLLDQERKNWQLELLSSQVLLDYSHKEFFLLAENQFNMFRSFVKYRDESIDGMVKELKFSKKNSFDNIESAVIIQGRKASLVKFCVSYMISIDKNCNISEGDEGILDDICAGIQLLDDLTDFIEDHNEGRTNIMLSTIYKWIESNYPVFNRKNISENQLIAGLILSQSLNTTLEFSNNLLKSVNQLKKYSEENSYSIEYFNELAKNCLQKSRLVDDIIQNYSRNISIYKKYLFQQGDNELNANLNVNESITNVFLDILSFVPKSSN